MKIMNKIVLSAVLASTCVGAYAQEETKVVEEFNPHFYVGAQIGAQYTLGEVEFGHLISPNGQVLFGYNFTKLWGVRLGVDAWQSKAGQKYYTDIATNQSSNLYWKWNYVAPSVDVTLNLTNLFLDYKADRTVNVGIFAGLGANIAFSNDRAADAKAFYQNELGYNDALEYLWDKRTFFQTRMGANIDFRLSDHWSLGLEAQTAVLCDRYNSKKADNADWYFNALVGVKYNFGKTHRSKSVPVERCQPTEKIVERIIERPAPAPAPVAAPVEQKAEVQPLRRDIFFVLSSSKVADAEQVKVMEVVDYLKKNPNAKVEVTGYADRGTGHSAINDKYAESRAKVVVEELKKQGVEESRISYSSKGDTEQPFEVNELNRVAICIAQ
jgi:outer membrane protein OmpA-like peptidoglycan-associated protein